jgi:subtilisin-like proprotein convertase family protein
MEFRLLAPDGVTTVNLITRRGGSADNFVNTVLDDSAATAISAGVAPFTGSFRPEQPLSAFNGLTGNGNWTLQLRDIAGGDLGVLQNWSITIGTPESNVLTDSFGNYSFFGLSAGAYILRIATPAGYNNTSSAIHNPNLPAGGFIGNLNYGLAIQNAIYGNVYNDQDAGGSQNGAEPGLPGWTVYRDVNGNNLYDVGRQTFNSGNINLTIPDNNTAWTSATQTVSGFTGTLTDINVLINMTHTWVADMEFRLVGPNGSTIVNLITQRGGSGDNFVNTVLDDQAAGTIASGTAPFTGSFRPEQPLSVYNGSDPNGVWTLQARDRASGDIGVLQNWSLIITDSSAEPVAVTDAAGNYVLSGLAAGAYSLRQVQQVGWLPINPSFGNGYNGTLNAGESQFAKSFGLQADAVVPTVQSINRANPNPTSAASVDFTVSFSEVVVGLTTGNFSLTAAGIAGASITGLSGSGSTYTVTVNTGSGDGTLRLNLANTTGLTDLALNPVSNTPFNGQVYDIDKTVPSVVSYKVIYGNNLAYNLIGSSRLTVPWSITAIEATFNESVGGTMGSLIRTNGAMSIAGFTGTGTNTLRWTLTSPITIDRIFSELQASGSDAVSDLAGNLLGGGTNYSRNFNVLYGDVNGDGFVSSADAVFVNNLIRTSSYNQFADLNGDGVVDVTDLNIARQRIGTKLP